MRFLGVSALLFAGSAAVTIAWCAPAREASRVDPLFALREA